MDKAVSMGVVWKDNMAVKEVFVDMDETNQRPFLAGIKLENGDFVPASAIHFTLGYKAKIVYENSDIEPLKDYTVSTAPSFIFVVKKTPEIKQFLKTYHRLSEVDLADIHFTEVAADDDHILVRATGGGFTGDESYPP